MSHPLVQMLAAALGTIGFAVLFGVPKRILLHGGFIGGMGWLLYILLVEFTTLDIFFTTLLATMLTVLMSRFAAVKERCPASVLVTCGILPLVPGAGIYWTAIYALQEQEALAKSSGLNALKIVFGIVLGILLVFELPQKFFHIFQKKTGGNP